VDADERFNQTVPVSLPDRPIGGPEDREGNPVAPRRLSEDDFVAATSAQPVKDISLPDDLRERLVEKAREAMASGCESVPCIDRVHLNDARKAVDAVLPTIREELAEAERRGERRGAEKVTNMRR
jgi:hypothetical protein